MNKLEVRCSDEALILFRMLADERGIPTEDWVRSAALRAAEESPLAQVLAGIEAGRVEVIPTTPPTESVFWDCGDFDYLDSAESPEGARWEFPLDGKRSVLERYRPVTGTWPRE